MVNGDVGQPEGLDHCANHLHLFANAIAQNEIHFRIRDGQWNAGESSPSPYIEHIAARRELHGFYEREAVQDVAFVKRVHVLPRNHIDGRIPLGVKGLELSELLHRLVRKLRNEGPVVHAQMVSRTCPNIASRASRARCSCAFTVPRDRSNSSAISS